MDTKHYYDYEDLDPYHSFVITNTCIKMQNAHRAYSIWKIINNIKRV